MPKEVSRLTSPIYREGRSREIISNDKDKAESGKTAEVRRTGSIAIGQGDQERDTCKSINDLMTGRETGRHGKFG